MTQTTTRLSLPLLAAGQAQKHVTHNDALILLDALIQLSVVDQNRTTPPTQPSTGDRHLIAASATGAWAGRSGTIACWLEGGWEYLVPQVGWRVWVQSEQATLVYDTAAWRDIKVRAADQFGIGATPDATNRLAVSSPASLFNHAGSGHQLKINKNATSGTASVLFQNGFSGRAEIGLTGSDSYQIKVSADGATWRDAVVIDPATGNVGIGLTAPEGPLHVLRGSAGVVIERVDNLTGGSGISTRKARGTITTKSVVLDGDILQVNPSQAWDGAAYLSCGNLRWVVDGAVSAGTVPTRVEFQTFTLGAGLTEKMRLTRDGNLGIGTTAPTCRLDVAGPARVGQYAKASMPSASTAGAGAMIYINDEIGGPVIGFSDGVAWRRVTDRAVVA